MKKFSKCLLMLMVLVCIAGINQSRAASLDIVAGTAQWFQGAYWESWDAAKAGRGVFPTFLAIQGHGISQGYNSDYRPVEFDETNASSHNYTLELASFGSFLLDGVECYTFGLDANQAPGTDPLIELTALELYQTSDSEPTGYPAGLGSERWSLGAGNQVNIDYNISSGGSGQPDMLVSIPVSLFNSSPYVVLYSQFSNDNDGPQEWDYLAGPGGAPPVPEPATIALLGAGLVGLAGFSRRKFKK